MHRTAHRPSTCHNRALRRRPDKIVGIMALCFSAVYFLSDVIESVQGGFSSAQLWLTLIAEAAVPIFVVGLALAHRPAWGRVGLISAAAYAYVYVFFTGTVIYALANDTPDYETLSDDLGLLMLVHGVIMVVAGLGFGWAVIRARKLPAWTAVALMTGVALVAVTQGMSDGIQLGAAGVRALGFAGMGAALVRFRSNHA